MMKTIDMQDLRYLNLFEKITGIKTRFCFTYNDTIFFCAPRQLIRVAVGPNGRNIRKINEITNRKIKIIPIPRGLEHAKPFIMSIVHPLLFKNIEINDKEIVLTAPRQSKAVLIGRNKQRLFEMKKIVKDFFEKDFRIA